MMPLTDDDTRVLVKSIATANDDTLDCDSCFEQMAEFVENELAGSQIPDALIAVKRHLEQCACCDDEHHALLEALQELNE